MRVRRGLLPMAVAVTLLAGCGGDDPAPPAATAGPTAAAPAQPSQPGSGPGGSDRRHAGSRTTEVAGTPDRVMIVEPAEPRPATAPVVLFTQGTGPEGYQGWIDHLVGRGSIVVFQDQSYDSSDLAARGAAPLAGLRVAVRKLAEPGHVRPRWDQLVLVGHSIGGVMSTQLAAEAGPARLPVPRAVLAVQPPAPDATAAKVFRAVPARTRVIVLASDQDDRVGDEPKAVWKALAHLPDRDYVLVRGDARGQPPLEAGHLFPLSGDGDEPDALDHGLWRILDGLRDCVAAGRGCAVERSMGSWSDGTPVTPLAITDSP